MFAEVEFFGLPLKKKGIHYDMDSIDEIKKGFMDFEVIFVEKLKKTAYDGAVVACANELAALLIEKFRKSPEGTEQIGLDKSEVPNCSFARVMCPNVLNDKTFQDCIRGIVEQAGYAFVGEISSGTFQLARSAS